MRRFIYFVAVSALAAHAGELRAAERVAVLLPQIRPAAAPEVRDRFHEAASRGLAASPDEVITGAEVRMRLGASEELLNCNGQGACVARAAQTLRADRLVTVDISQIGKDYAIKTRLLDPVGRETAKVDETCDVCTVKEAEDAVARATTKLAANIKPAPVEPPKPEPVAPVEKPAPVEQEKPPIAAPAPVKREGRGFPYRPVGITSIVVGALAIGAGIGLVVIDGQPTCSLPNPKVACPDLYNTAGGGGALIGIGAGGLIAGGVLLYFDHRARTRNRATAAQGTADNGTGQPH
jgi:hypothetical protein